MVTGGIGSGVIAGRVITFTLLGGDTLNYKLSIDSGAAAGRVHFSGVLKAVDGSSQDILGDDEVTIVVAAQDTPTPAPTAEPEPTPDTGSGPSRSLPGNAVAPGSSFNVNIDSIGIGGGFGQIEETLPSGFSYVADSATVVDGVQGGTVGGSVSGQTVTFTLLGVESFSYQAAVGASVSDGSHSFSGIFKDSPSSSGTSVGGNQAVTVQAPAPMPISRSFSDDPTDAGMDVTVTIANIGIGGGFGQIEETLPDGISYVDSSVSVVSGVNGATASGTAAGQIVTFTLLGTDSISYDVSVDAAATDGLYEFSGVLRDAPGATGTAIGGDTSLRVGPEPTPVPTATPEPTATPVPDDPNTPNLSLIHISEPTRPY